ncbi:MAG: hypothetical protein JJU24_13170 [Natronohydrobacter sp.]|nr:hypothetical protein [Natronohydrobacter sp.]
MTRTDASELSSRLAACAEVVCRHYLPQGEKSGRYWLIGDARGTPGRSLFVRLTGPDRGKGAAGKWTDAQSGEHGDLLDIIRESLGLGQHVSGVVRDGGGIDWSLGRKRGLGV